MKIISFIEDEENIKKILKHLNLWEIQNHSPPSNFNIPKQFKNFIMDNSDLIGKRNDNSETYNRNKFDDIDNEAYNSFPNYDVCDEMPKYEEWL